MSRMSALAMDLEEMAEPDIWDCCPGYEGEEIEENHEFNTFIEELPF